MKQIPVLETLSLRLAQADPEARRRVRNPDERFQNDRHEGRSAKRADALAIAAIVAVILAFFWKVVFSHAMFFHRDVFSYTYPHARFIHDACRRGYLPFWNPYTNYGEPVLSNPNFLFFYPYTLLIVLLPVEFAYTMHYVVHFALLGVGTYLLARRWEQSRAAALFAALAFTLCGPVLSLGSFYNHTACATWIPWALLAADRAIDSRSMRPWILLAAVFTLQMLAGEPFTLLGTFGLVAAYVFHRRGNLRKPLAARNQRLLGCLVVVGASMLALSAAQFLPAAHLLRNSRRGLEGLPYGEITSWSFHPLFLLEMVMPDFFGNSLESPSLWTSILSFRNKPYLPIVFVGFIPLFLALAGWALGRNRRRNFVAVSAVVMLLLSFGRFFPLFPLAYLLFPPLELVRFPVKLLIPAALLMSLLAGWGIDALRRADLGSQTPWRTRLLLPLKVLLGGILLAWTISWLAPDWMLSPASWVLQRTDETLRSTPSGRLTPAELKGAKQFLQAMLKLHLPGLGGFALGAILWLLALEDRKRWATRALPFIAVVGILQLILENSSANPTVPKTFYTYRPPVLASFEHSREPYRFCYVFRESGPVPAAVQAQEFLNFDSIPETREFPSNALVPFRDRLLLARTSMLTETEGVFNTDVEGSYPLNIYEFWIFALRQLKDPARVDCLFGRTNVRYQVVRTRPEDGAAREVAEIFNGSAQPSYLYENPCLMPRAYVAGQAVYSGNSLETLEHLSAANFDERNEVILASGPASGFSLSASQPAGRVEIVDRQPNAVKLAAELIRPAYVVLLDRFDPNWHATNDGRDVAILRANHMFRAVRCEAGRHEVRFEYRQAGLKTGALLSLVAFLGLALAYVIDPHFGPPGS